MRELSIWLPTNNRGNCFLLLELTIYWVSWTYSVSMLCQWFKFSVRVTTYNDHWIRFSQYLLMVFLWAKCVFQLCPPAATCEVPASFHWSACSLVGFSQDLSAMIQCFPLTANQHQPGLSTQKPTNEQAGSLNKSTMSLVQHNTKHKCFHAPYIGLHLHTTTVNTKYLQSRAKEQRH